MGAISGVFERRGPSGPTGPFAAADALQSGVAICADARLDNRAELLDAFGIPSSQSALSDNLLFLRAWQTWGEACPRHLVGDYAFAVWDATRRTLFCARDHIGARPFYYCLTPERFVFASDIRGVLSAPGVSDKLDEEYLIASLADRSFYRSDRTYLADVRRLPPGHSLTVTRDGDRLARWWFPAEARPIRFAAEGDYAEAARELLTRAVADRLRTHESVGVHLSGGLDSSAVTVLAARARCRQGQAPPLVFSWQPPPDAHTPRSREHARIEAVCAQERLTPQYCPANVDDILSVLKRDPTRDPIHCTLPTEATIQRQAAGLGVRLMLSGWGGDEGISYSGRGYHAELLLRGLWWRLLRESRVRRSSSLRNVALDTLLLLFPDRERGLKQLAKRSLRFAPHVVSYIHPSLKPHIRLHKIPCRQTSIRSTLFWLWDRGCLAERMESWVAFGAPAGIDYAFPLLDRRLLEFVAGLPREQFVRGPWTRWLMRSAMDGILPPEVRWQPDKSEPVRADQALASMHQTFGLIGEQIAASPAFPARAGYLDMSRLMTQLTPEALARRPRPGKIQRALQFLDF